MIAVPIIPKPTWPSSSFGRMFGTIRRINEKANPAIISIIGIAIPSLKLHFLLKNNPTERIKNKTVKTILYVVLNKRY